jgi:hypothetical protein
MSCTPLWAMRMTVGSPLPPLLSDSPQPESSSPAVIAVVSTKTSFLFIFTVLCRN